MVAERWRWPSLVGWPTPRANGSAAGSPTAAHRHEVEKHNRAVSKVVRKQLRTAFSVLIVCMIAFTAWAMMDHKDPWSQAVLTGLQWSAITAIHTSQAEVGTTGVSAVHNIGGTVFGGLCGWGAAHVAREVPSVAPLWVANLCSLGTFLYMSVCEIQGIEFGGIEGATAAILIAWEGYTNAEVCLQTLFTTRVAGICFGALLAQVSALIIFPMAASRAIPKQVSTAVDRLRTQCTYVWEALEAQDLVDDLEEEFFRERDLLISEIKVVKDEIPKTKMERHVSNPFGGGCWLPKVLTCNRGLCLDTEALLEFLDLLLHAQRLITTLFMVVKDIGRDRPDILAMLHSQYREPDDGGISALRKLRLETASVWRHINSALVSASSEARVVFRSDEGHVVLEIVERMLQSSGFEGGRMGDDGYREYRWHTFMVLYRDLGALLPLTLRAASKWQAWEEHGEEDGREAQRQGRHGKKRSSKSFKSSALLYAPALQPARLPLLQGEAAQSEDVPIARIPPPGGRQSAPVGCSGEAGPTLQLYTTPDA